jgi:hypothetical protein
MMKGSGMYQGYGSGGESMNPDLERKATDNGRKPFSMFPVGRRVKVIVPCEDFYFFNGDTGQVTKNTGGYLGIRVKFDEPRHFDDGYVQEDFNFNPKSLERLEPDPEAPSTNESPDFMALAEEILVEAHQDLARVIEKALSRGGKA